jgi:hypothetical protein
MDKRKNGEKVPDKALLSNSLLRRKRRKKKIPLDKEETAW